MAGRILVVDDETNILNLIRMYLERDGFFVFEAQEGLEALNSIRQNKPDLVVLDIMLPGMDGFEVCRQVRMESDVPILMLTARDEDIDKIVGLELGADDYLTKPFNPRELVARVKAILRRVVRSNGVEEKPLQTADVQLDPSRREVHINNEPVMLRTKEFDLLQVFMGHEGLVLSREKLLSLAWGYDFYGQTRTVDVHVAQLRKKLEGSQIRIETVTGVGYKLVADSRV
ncbi:MAG: response regulator transcription factor [Anaerolineales bacterium]|nr:response regulator transcription factor [Anaerolineales bacterium]